VEGVAGTGAEAVASGASLRAGAWPVSPARRGRLAGASRADSALRLLPGAGRVASADVKSVGSGAPRMPMICDEHSCQRRASGDGASWRTSLALSSWSMLSRALCRRFPVSVGMRNGGGVRAAAAGPAAAQGVAHRRLRLAICGTAALELAAEGPAWVVGRMVPSKEGEGKGQMGDRQVRARKRPPGPDRGQLSHRLKRSLGFPALLSAFVRYPHQRPVRPTYPATTVPP
jgi:hypothetical protein